MTIKKIRQELQAARNEQFKITQKLIDARNAASNAKQLIETRNKASKAIQNNGSA